MHACLLSHKQKRNHACGTNLFGRDGRKGEATCCRQEVAWVLSVATVTHFLRLYGDWFQGRREMLSCDALLLTAAGVRPSFRAITRVGVLPLASWRSAASSVWVHCFPVFWVDLLIAMVLSAFLQSATGRPLGNSSKDGLI